MTRPSKQELARRLASEGRTFTEIATVLRVGVDQAAAWLRPADDVERSEALAARSRSLGHWLTVLPRPLGDNADGEEVIGWPGGPFVRIGQTPAVRFVRPAQRITKVPPWALWPKPHEAVGESERGALACPHCFTWRTVAELTDPANCCPIGLMPRPGALLPIPGYR